MSAGLITIPVKRVEGFTLIEVLVAFLILSVGLIGLAGLQLSGVKHTRDAYYQTQATVLAADIMDKMRSNLDNLTSYRVASASAQPTCYASGGCSGTAMASNDVYGWRTAVASSLPNGDAIVCLDSSNLNDGTSATSSGCDGAGVVSVVKIWWSDVDAATASADRRLYSVLFRPQL